MADISVTLVLDDKGFVKGVNQAQNQVKQFGSTVDKEIGSNASKAFEGLKGAIAGIGFTSMIAELASLAGETVKTAQSLGTSTAAVKAWQMSLGAAGGDMDNARDALIDLTQKMNEAITSGGDVKTAFQKIGLSLQDLQTMSNEDMMKAVIQGLANVRDGAERSRLALVLMGEDAKNVDWTKVARDYDQMATSAGKIAPKLEEARKAQQEFNSTYNKFVDQLTVAIPWDTMAAGLKSIGDNVNTIMETAKSVGILVATLSGLKVITPFIESFGKLVLSMSVTKAAGESLFSMFKATASGAAAAKGISTITETVGALHKGMLPTFTSLERFGILIRGVTSGFVAMIPFIGQVIAGFTLLNEATRILTGNSLIDWADSGIESIQNLGEEALKYAGIIEKTSREERAYRDNVRKIAIDQDKEEKAAAEAKALAEQKKQESLKRTSQLLNDTTKAVNDIVKAYQLQNAETIKSIQDQTALIGLSGDAATKKKALIDLENEHIKKVQELNDKLAAPNLDPAEQKIYQQAIADVNAEYNKSVIALSDVMDAQNKANESNRLAVFSNTQLEESWKRISDIQNETAKIGLPLVEQKYRDIEAAATSAIRAQVAAEAQARGIKPNEVPVEVVSKITDEVRKQLDYEKEMVLAQEKVTEQYNLQLFGASQLSDAQQQIVDIQNQTANALLPEIARKEAEITQAAEARALAEIQAEEARRGQAMGEDERLAYLKAAKKGTEDLIKVTRESLEQSRSWGYGWQKAFIEYQDNATNAANQAATIFANATRGMEDVLVNFARTGKFEWKNFVASLIEDLLRAQIQSIFASTIGGMMGIGDGGKQTGGGLMGSISSMFGGGNNQKQSGGGLLGSIGKGIGSLFGGGGGGSILGSIGKGIGSLFSGFFATGGMIPPGRFGVVGENGPEFVQGPATVTPTAQMGGSVTYNINALDARSFKEMIASDPTFLYAVTLQGAKGVARR
jgi:lambda family phage tail tape measure protein